MKLLSHTGSKLSRASASTLRAAAAAAIDSPDGAVYDGRYSVASSSPATSTERQRRQRGPGGLRLAASPSSQRSVTAAFSLTDTDEAASLQLPPQSPGSKAGADRRVKSNDVSGSSNASRRSPARDPQNLQLDEGTQIEEHNDGHLDDSILQAYGKVRAGHEDHKRVSEKTTKMTKIGTLEISTKYDNTVNVVTVKVIQTHELPRPGTYDFGGKIGTGLKWNAIQVTLALLPDKKQRHRTDIAKGDNPQFDKSFQFTDVSTDDFCRLAIRFRAYGCEHKRRKLLMAENILALASLATPKNESILHLPLELRVGDYGRKGSASTQSKTTNLQVDGWTSLGVTGFPELFIGITYNATTGQLATEVIKGSSFKLPGMTRAPDTYVKLSLMASNGHVLYKSKSPSSEGNPNPMWKENFVFPVNKFQLSDITILCAVYAKKTMNRREIIGWFSIGSNNSGEEELAHWQDMVEAKGTQVCRWHRLLQTDKKA